MAEFACILHVALGHDAFRHCVDSILGDDVGGRGRDVVDRLCNMT